SVLFNGSPMKEFNMERGVRQGDPLWPFLFILAAEGLNALINKAMARDIFKGWQIGNDDINLNKSKLYGVGVEKTEVERMARFMGCGFGEFPFTYLGLHIRLNMRRASAWNLVIEWFKNRLSEWKAHAMSFEGRLTLKHGRIEIIPNDQGNKTTLSIVDFADKKRLIGNGANNQLPMNPSNTIFG
nr:reverse transcriptase domain, reverse transcriptase zinc-binding domain protein [Tanacetum cinerariifolium]